MSYMSCSKILEIFLMIDMTQLRKHSDYVSVLVDFKNSFSTDCNKDSWAVFIPMHLLITKNRCPICECKLDGSVTRTSNNGTMSLSATIDHYRPQKFYSFLKCDDENYLVMCNDCNNVYKGNNFPLFENQVRALTKETIVHEKSLLVNPINDDIYELFDLVFRRTTSNKNVLELQPKRGLIETDYLFQKAKESIATFGLGNCENMTVNQNAKACRIEILEEHFGIFYGFAKALLDENKITATKLLKENKIFFESYGLFSFLKKKQFIDLVI